MRQHAGGTVAKGVVDAYPAPPRPQVVELKMAEVRRVLGMDMPLEECERILTDAGVQGRAASARTRCA